MKKKEKTCVVGYKTGITERGLVHGHVFSELNECCSQFRTCFYGTGNHKIADFNENTLYDDTKNGFNLVTRGCKIQVVLRISKSRNDYHDKDNSIRFCPFCGAKVEIKETDRVELKTKYKFVGYAEQKIGG